MFFIGICVALCALIMDQLHKWYMLEIINIDERPTMVLTGFFNLVMVWNTGISFGIGNQTPYAAMVFTIVALMIVIALIIWLRFSHSAFLSTALGLIIGGAIGNIIDRIRFGAVADFFDFHYMGYHWPAFNIADSAVFIGAIMLIIDSIFFHEEADEKT